MTFAYRLTQFFFHTSVGLFPIDYHSQRIPQLKTKPNKIGFRHIHIVVLRRLPIFYQMMTMLIPHPQGIPVPVVVVSSIAIPWGSNKRTVVKVADTPTRRNGYL